MKQAELPFIAPCIAMWVLDAAATLVGQPDGYWLGDYGTALELNPLFHKLLVIGPWAFVLAAAASMAFFFTVLRFFNPTLASAVLFLAAILHFAAAGSWIIKIPYWGIVVLLFVGLAIKKLLDRDWDRFVRLTSNPT